MVERRAESTAHSHKVREDDIRQEIMIRSYSVDIYLHLSKNDFFSAFHC